MATGRGGSARLDEPMVHGCGKELWTTASYAIHAKSCSGEEPKTEGAIAARTKRSAKRPARTDPPPREEDALEVHRAA